MDTIGSRARADHHGSLQGQDESGGLVIGDLIIHRWQVAVVLDESVVDRRRVALQSLCHAMRSSSDSSGAPFFDHLVHELSVVSSSVVDGLDFLDVEV
jgi:hypothetical protein